MSTPRLSFTTPLRLVTLTPSLSDLNLSSTSLDVPDVETIVLESGDGAGPDGRSLGGYSNPEFERWVQFPFRMLIAYNKKVKGVVVNGAN